MATLTEYQRADELPVPVAFPPLVIDSLAAYLSRLGMRQLHVAETEKYAHVTYFFNGGVEEAFAGEDRVLVPSRRDVPTYDLAPEMSAGPITDAGRDRHRLRPIRLHPGQLREPRHGRATPGCGMRPCARPRWSTAAWPACWRRRCAAGGALIVTADHGNIEEMRDAAGAPQTKHTTAPVPLAARRRRGRDTTLRDGTLADVAPTICALLGVAAAAVHDRAEPDRGLTLLDSAAMTPLVVAQTILAVALVASILLQQRGTGLGGAFGGEVTAYRSRRGIERTLFRLTILLAVLFVIFSLLNLL